MYFFVTPALPPTQEDIDMQTDESDAIIKVAFKQLNLFLM